MTTRPLTTAPTRIILEHPAPTVDCGRYPAKRCAGDTVAVGVDVVRDGHEVLRAAVRYRPEDDPTWRQSPLDPPAAGTGSSRFTGAFEVDAIGRWLWTVVAWQDAFASWRDELTRKLEAGERELDSELAEGAQLLARAAERTAGDGNGTDLDTIARAQTLLEDPRVPLEERARTALQADLQQAVGRHPDLSAAAELERPILLDVDRPRARFGAWYELFPRSWGGFAGVESQLDHFQRLGIDVLYLPPIHPIGRTNRKGRNNALRAGPTDPGSPWAIGGPEGGHTAIHPDLGSIQDFERLVAAARERDIDVALDFAINCSADHPWLTEHPEWFHRRPDGTLKYAENPPKKYQDIYNLNFDADDWQGLWDALYEVVETWVARGVRIFRVDNPHTKPLPFWEWLIRGIRKTNPDVFFLSEAFTHRALMEALAKVGFSQSYTYFTWKNSRWELTDYLAQLTGESAQYLRPNFFVNTPDILTVYLAEGGRPAFEARLILAATLSPTYGIYSGFENVERTPVRPGSEEYLDSEKYEVKQRALDGELLPLVERLNAIRRASPALQRLDNLTFLETENEALIAYAKQTVGGDTILCVVNTDPAHAQEGLAIVPHDLGLPPAFAVTDLLTGERFGWGIGRNYVRLDPATRVAHVLQVTP